MQNKTFKKQLTAAAMAASLLLPTLAQAQTQEDIHEDASGFRMAGDLLVARPLGAVITVAGTAAWIVSLPFTLLGGNAHEAAETLMIGPAEATFVRCLGCRRSGRSNSDAEYAAARKAEREAREAEEAAIEATEGR